MKTKVSYELGFVGLGKMAQVILKSLLHSRQITPEKVIASRRTIEALKPLKRQLKIDITTSNLEVAQSSRWLWLGIKPFQVAEVLAEIRERLGSSSVVVSMLAGVTTKTIQKHLGRKLPVVRLMPNTPALLGEGVTGVYFSPEVPASKRKLCLQWLKKLGLVHVVAQEAKLDGITGLCGSGPAFVYEVAAGLIAGAELSGIPSAKARELAVQTLLGAARMLESQDQSPEALIAQVVSKGGTTEAGLKVLTQKKVAAAVAQAVTAATQRAEAIRKELESCTP